MLRKGGKGRARVGGENTWPGALVKRYAGAILSGDKFDPICSKDLGDRWLSTTIQWKKGPNQGERRTRGRTDALAQEKEGWLHRAQLAACRDRGQKAEASVARRKRRAVFFCNGLQSRSGPNAACTWAPGRMTR